MIAVEYFLYFIIYSFLGWTMEVLCKFRELHKFVNRGFLIGPICPIYGYGVLLIVILIGNTTSDPLAVFLKSILVCSVLEYLTSYVMEKLFKARWWDYSRRKFNINGRVCLETMIPFGLLGTGVVYVLHPAVKKLVSFINPTGQIILASIILVIYLLDNVVSYFVMFKIKKQIKHAEKDNTEAVRSQVLNWLEDNNILYRRLREAYPNVIIMFNNAKEAVVTAANNAKATLTNAASNAAKQTEELKEKVAQKSKEVKEKTEESVKSAIEKRTNNSKKENK